MTYAANSTEVQRGVVGCVDKILKGVKPAGLACDAAHQV
jgi:hypothetical protein